MTRVLEAVDLVKRFKGRTVVDRVSLTVKPGQVVGLLGPNGAGKTTVFKLILGLLSPDAGSVRFGMPLGGLTLYKRARLGLGYLPQNPSLFRGLTVRENLMAVLEAQKRRAPAQEADEILRQFNLSRVAHSKARILSGGERRKLEFARALSARPQILLCDEPFAGVDPIAAEEIAETIEDLAAQGIGVLMTDHNVRGALSACTEIHILVDGIIQKSGSPDEIRTSERIKRLYLGSGF